jgi:hypothetical protein
MLKGIVAPSCELKVCPTIFFHIFPLNKHAAIECYPNLRFADKRRSKFVFYVYRCNLNVPLA